MSLGCQPSPMSLGCQPLAYVAVFRYQKPPKTPSQKLSKDTLPDRPEAVLMIDTDSGLVNFQSGYTGTLSGWQGGSAIKNFKERHMARCPQLAFGTFMDVQFRWRDLGQPFYLRVATDHRPC